MSTVQSLQRAFAMLRVLAQGAAGVTEIADQLDLPKSTVSRLLSALEQERAVEQVEVGGSYQVGSLLGELAGASQPDANLAAVARPHLVELEAATGETAGVSIRRGRDMFFVEHVESDNVVMVQDWTGTYAPMHTVPSGLVILANCSSAEFDDYLSGRMEPYTDHTWVDGEELRARFREIRRCGYSWVHEEFADGLNSVAAPVRGRSGEFEAALHVHGPAYRFPKESSEEQEIGSLVADAAHRLSELLTS